jgi:hypothetical protein
MALLFPQGPVLGTKEQRCRRRGEKWRKREIEREEENWTPEITALHANMFRHVADYTDGMTF